MSYTNGTAHVQCVCAAGFILHLVELIDMAANDGTRFLDCGGSCIKGRTEVECDGAAGFIRHLVDLIDMAATISGRISDKDEKINEEKIKDGVIKEDFLMDTYIPPAGTAEAPKVVRDRKSVV